MLFYRVDLLRKYGYRAPPKTWEELEVMARRIQSGERASGNKDFWGFVWEGAPSEVLTCNALEWQVSDGGGTILEQDGKVTVNNPRTIRAWQRAARWVGSISPPGSRPL
jgi:trehalose/maltose transport system substrate-binding protein